MRNRRYHILPIILTSMLLLIQSGPAGMLKMTPATLMSEDSYECLTFQNVSHDYDYNEPSQDAFNITADLFNHCSERVIYPSTLILNDTQGISTSLDDDNFRQGVDENSSYQVMWEVTRDSTVAEGTFVSFELHPTRNNCYADCAENQNFSYNLTVPFGLVDVNACYAIENITDDYSPSQSSFNLSAELNNTCWGGNIHYPAGILVEGAGYSSSPAEGAESIGQIAYVLFENTSTMVNWHITLDQDLTEGTSLNFSLQPSCSVYTSTYQISPSYMQDCSLSTFDSVSHTVMNGTPSNQTHWPERIFVWPDDVGGYNTTQIYSLTYNSGDNLTVHTLYELDNLVNNVTYRVEWYISNGATNFLSLVASGNFTTNSSNNTGYSAPIPNAALNLSEDCYVVGAELYDDTGQLLDFDEFLLCIDGVSNATTTTDSDGDSILDSDDDCPNTPSEVPVDSHGCPEESIHIWPDGVGGYAGRAHNYGLAFNTTMNSVITLYEVDHLASNTTYRIEWYISNGSAPPYVVSGNLTTDDVNNTGYATPLHSALNLSNDCYTIWAELYDDAGVLRDDDEFTFCFVLTGSVMAWHTEHYNNGYDQNFFGIDAALYDSYPSFFTLGQVVTIHVDGTSYDYFISHLTGAGNNMSGIEHDNVRYLYLIDPDGTRAHGWEHGWVLKISDTFTIDGRNTTNQTFDGDGDGILDSQDDCPNTPTGTAVGYHGCPEEDTGADNGNSEEEENSGEVASGFVPGFGIILGICALIGAASFLRKSR